MDHPAVKLLHGDRLQLAKVPNETNDRRERMLALPNAVQPGVALEAARHGALVKRQLGLLLVGFFKDVPHARMDSVTLDPGLLVFHHEFERCHVSRSLVANAHVPTNEAGPRLQIERWWHFDDVPPIRGECHALSFWHLQTHVVYS